MFQRCCIKICKNKTSKNSRLSFYSFPRHNDALFKKWLQVAKISRDAWQRNKDLRICSDHFIKSDFILGGNISKLNKKAVPSVHIEHMCDASCDENDDVILLPPEEIHVDVVGVLKKQENINEEKLRMELMKKEEIITELKNEVQALRSEMEYLRRENNKLQSACETNDRKRAAFSMNRFENNNNKIRYYTGLQSYDVLLSLFSFLLPTGNCKDLNIHDSANSEQFKKQEVRLDVKDQLFLTLCRLRRGFHYETLADMFLVSKTNAANIFLCWINLMYLRLGKLNMWPHRDVLIFNAPASFQENYKNVVGSINCTEFYIQSPSSLVLQSQCYSQYKSGTTLKSLIFTDPNGSILYMSPLFTGCISDKNIIIQSGFVDIIKKKVAAKELLPGDIILADKGFNVASLFIDANIEINIPTFRVTGSQFTPQEVEWTRKIAHERIHVERHWTTEKF